MDRVFLDANVLFSAAYRPGAGLQRLWSLKRARLLTSRFAVEEALANLPEETQIRRLKRFLSGMELVPEADVTRTLPESLSLAEKDRPVLAAALAAGATHFLTGDLRHFGNLFGETVRGLRILRPSQYLRPGGGR